MPVYLAANLLSVVMSSVLVPYGVEGRRKIPLLWLPILPMLLVSVLRYDVGTDYTTIYLTGFEGIKNGQYWVYSWWEPGYVLVNRAALALGLDATAVFGLMAILFFTFIYAFILDRSDNVPLSMLILFLGQLWLASMNLVRQAAAIAICCFATRYVERERPLPYFALVALAASFHSTCLLFVPLYWMLRWRFSQVGVLFFAVGLFVVSYAAPSAFEWVASALLGKDSGYFSSSYFKGRVYYTELLVALVIAMLMMLTEDRDVDEPSSRSVTNLVYASLFIAAMSAAIPNAERVNLYFTASYVVTIPLIARRLRGTSWQGVVICCLVLLFAFRLVYDTYLLGDSNGVEVYRTLLLPYEFSFEGWFH